MPLILAEVLLWEVVICLRVIGLTRQLQLEEYDLAHFLGSILSSPLQLLYIFLSLVFAIILLRLYPPTRSGSSGEYATQLVSLFFNCVFGVISLFIVLILFKVRNPVYTDMRAIRLLVLALIVSLIAPLIWLTFDKDLLNYAGSVPLEMLNFEGYLGGAVSAIIVLVAVPVAWVIDTLFVRPTVDTFLRDQRQ